MATSVSARKAAVNYQPKPEPDACRNCSHFTFDIEVVPWAVRDINNGRGVYVMGVGTVYKLEELHDGFKRESNLRCQKHGFAVKKMAICDTHERKEATK